MPLVTLLLAVALAATPIEPARPAKLPPSATEMLIKTMYRDRERAENWLRNDAQSYLAATQRVDFAGKPSLVLGSSADCDVRIDDPLFRPHHLRVTVLGDSFRVQAIDDSAQFRLDEAAPRDTVVGPTALFLGKQGMVWGRYRLRISHQYHPALILFDAFSPRFQEFRGLKHYPADLAYRFTLPLEVNPAPDTIAIASTRGSGRKAVRLGWFHFMIGEKRCRLTALRMIEPGLPPDNMAVFFKDPTNGKETSSIGRYLEVRRIGQSVNYMLDFNSATNPSCAFSDLYNCPIPPKENLLKVPILAGEKDMGYLAAKK